MQWAGSGSLWTGAGAPLRAAGFIMRHPGLWLPSLLPLLLNIALFSAMYWMIFSMLPGWLDQWLPQQQGWLWAVLYYVVLVLVVILALTAGVYLFSAVGRILAAPFLEILTRKTEEAATGAPAPEGPGWLASIARVAWQESLKLVIYAGLLLALMLLSLIMPLVGGGPSAILAWLVTVFFLAMEFMDYPLERRGLGLREKAAAVWDTTPGWLGFGGSVFALGIVPLVNILLLPLAAVGGTLFFLELRVAPQGQN